MSGGASIDAAEAERAWRLIKDYNDACRAQAPQDQDAALFRQMDILTAAGALLLRFWQEELRKVDGNGKDPSPQLRLKRRLDIIATDWDDICADGRARWVAARAVLERDPAQAFIKEAQGLQSSLAALTRQGSKEVAQLRTAIETCGTTVNDVFAQANFDELRSQVAQLDARLEAIHRASQPREKTWFGWRPHPIAEWFADAIAFLWREGWKVISGILTAIVLLWAIRGISDTLQSPSSRTPIQR